jgi:hypothetical protein
MRAGVCCVYERESALKVSIGFLTNLCEATVLGSLTKPQQRKTSCANNSFVGPKRKK